MSDDNEELKAKIEKLTALVENQQKEIEEAKRKEEETKKSQKKDKKDDDEKKGFNGVACFFIVVLVVALGALGVYGYQKLTGKKPEKINLPEEKKKITKTDEADQININALLQVDNVTFTPADGYENCLWLNYDFLVEKRKTEWNITINQSNIGSKVVVTKFDGTSQEYDFKTEWPYSYTFASSTEASRTAAPTILLVNVKEEEIKSITLTNIVLTNSMGNLFYDKRFEIKIK